MRARARTCARDAHARVTRTRVGATGATGRKGGFLKIGGRGMASKWGLGWPFFGAFWPFFGLFYDPLFDPFLPVLQL